MNWGVSGTALPGRGVSRATVGDGPGRPWARRGGRIPAALGAVGGYLALRVLASVSYACCVAVFGRYGGRTLFTPEDSGWYRIIAEHGYDQALGVRYHGSVYGFFPLYPLVMRYGSDATGLSVDQVGLAVTWLAAAAAAWAAYELGARLRSPRTGMLLACLWALVPSAVVESVMYADTLSIALAAWALLAMLRRRWLTAGVLGALAGSARPTTVAAAAVVSLAAFAAYARPAEGRERSWRMLAAGLLAPAGAAAFLTYVAVRGSSAKAYVNDQAAGWGNHPDYGISTLRHLYAGLGFTGDPAYRTPAAVISTVVILAVPVLIGIQIRQRQPWPLIAYTVLLTLVVYGDDHFYTTTPREVLPLLPVLLAPAALLERIRRRTALVGLLAVLAAASGWYACYVPVMTGPVP
jgi:hypothetical protein